MGPELVAASAAGVLVDIGRSLREAFYMWWETLWALVLGFGLSGAVQAFASRGRIQGVLGSHRPASVLRASLLGMASSSCSYAASAMARALVVRGADFVAAMVFMVASTNLVVELGIVLLVLIGWQFVVAELVGGAIMIVLLASLGGLWLRGRAVVRARSVAVAAGGDVATGMADAAGAGKPWRSRVRTAGGWSDAAAYAISDLRMLRRELAVGFVVAGFVTVLVPAHAWSDLFVRGHGFWTVLENVVLGPFVALVSFVCSVGNVPLAAALWRGGIGFGGVVAFVFADLISLPLLLVYRRQYGARMAMRMLGVFWLVMSSGGLAVQYLFQAVGWVPASRRGVVAGDTVRWNATTALDIVALLVFAGLYWLYRNRERLGGGAGYAADPVCGMQVQGGTAAASLREAGRTIYFCSERCRDRFVSAPGRYPVAGAPPARGDPRVGSREGEG